jgi:DNA-binding NarL/FixJ family response regulator
MPSKKVLIVEDDPFIAEDLRGFLLEFGYAVPAIARNMEEAIHAIEKWQPQAVLLDINLGRQTSGLDIARWINEHHPMPFIYLTGYADDGTVREASGTHPGAYLLKPFTGPDIKIALEIAISNFQAQTGVLAGPIMPDTINPRLPHPLSEREADVLNALAEGLSNQGIAKKLFISENTVKTHLQHIFDKLEVKTRTEALYKIRQLLLH